MSKINQLLPNTMVVCTTPTAPLRAHPSETSELVTQLLYGESATVLHTGEKDWVQIITETDHYTAWVDQKHLSVKSGEPVHFMSTAIIQPVNRTNDVVFLPFGALLTPAEVTNETICQPIIRTGKSDARQIENMARMFLNAPYLWGGKTVLGIDCSGLTQLVYQAAGVQMPRNASQQCQLGTAIDLENAMAGDLAFFQNDKGRVVHVGILLPENKIIHASGFVRIDTLTSEGIINEQSKKLTHLFHSIRRLFT